MINYIKENLHLFIIAAVNFIFIFASSFVKGYEYFIDEFYYIACSNNPAFGYVDHPPLAPLALMFYKFVFGESLYAIRFLPAVAASATVFLTGIITKQLGGNKKSQLIAAFAVFTSPVFLTFGSFYSMNVFEPLLTAIGIYFMIRMINDDNPKFLVYFGIVAGLMLMNKHTSLLFILFVFGMLIFTEYRRFLLTKHFIYGILLMLLIFIPNIIWQVQNGFPSLEFYMTNIAEKNVKISVSEYLSMMMFGYNPFVLLICFCGTAYFLFIKKFAKYRLFALVFLAAFIFFFVFRTGRVDRPAFAIITIIPAGAIFLYNFVSRFKQMWIIPALGILSLLCMLTVTPLLIPFLNYENTERLTNFLGLNTEMEKGKKPKVTQMISDRIGWKEKAEMVGCLYQSFPEDEKKKMIVGADYYGIAGALELYGKKYGIEEVVCTHNNYFLWSKSRLKGDVMIRLTKKSSYKWLKEAFNVVDSTDVYYDNEYCSPEGRQQTVFICRDPKHSNEELLEDEKNFY